MTDLKALAHELLHEAKQSLQANGHLNPTAIVITPTQNLIFDVAYQNEGERDDIYSEIVEAALEKSATAILTVDDVHLEGPGSPARLQGQGWGALTESATEATIVTLSGSGFTTRRQMHPSFLSKHHPVSHPAPDN